MHHFMRKHGFDNYDDLYQWSIDESAVFWESLCEFCGVRCDTPATTTLSRPDDIMDAGWFAGSKLNYAAHLCAMKVIALPLFFMARTEFVAN